jgi:hypothetical protein
MNDFLVWMFGCLLILCTGCSINDTGLINNRYFENETSYLMVHEAWGGYISTRQADGGLTLGHAKRFLIYPKPHNQTGVSMDEFLKHAKYHGFEREIEEKDVDLMDQQPYAWIEKNQGIMLHTNPLKTGVSGGMESRSVIRLPDDFDGVFVFSYQRDGRIEAGIYEPSKNN